MVNFYDILNLTPIKLRVYIKNHKKIFISIMIYTKNHKKNPFRCETGLITFFEKKKKKMCTINYLLNSIFLPTSIPLFLANTPHMWYSILAPTFPSQSSSPGATSTKSNPMMFLPLSPSLLNK